MSPSSKPLAGLLGGRGDDSGSSGPASQNMGRRMVSFSASSRGPAPEGLGDGSGASAAGPAVGDKGVGAEGGKRFYADINRKKDNSGYRITYTTDGKVFKHVDSPAEIPMGPGDKVYVDTIPIIHTDGFVELLRRLSMIEAVRQRLNIK